jgi:hypothetical protein
MPAPADGADVAVTVVIPIRSRLFSLSRTDPRHAGAPPIAGEQLHAYRLWPNSTFDANRKDRGDIGRQITEPQERNTVGAEASN